MTFHPPYLLQYTPRALRFSGSKDDVLVVKPLWHIFSIKVVGTFIRDEAFIRIKTVVCFEVSLMTTLLEKSMSLGVSHVFFFFFHVAVSCFFSFPFGVEGRIWTLIVSAPDHCPFTFIQ